MHSNGKRDFTCWETLQDKIDFEIKFNTYAMHGEKELAEQLNQYCIKKNKMINLLIIFLVS
jgi:hypothetical protein